MSFMTPEERIQALEALEEKQQRLQRRAALSAWISVAIAAVVLVGLISFAVSQLNGLRQETATLEDKKHLLEADIVKLTTEKDMAEKKTAVTIGALSEVSESQRKAAVDKQLAASPGSAALLPRIYMQTVSRDDEARAQQIRKVLAAAGYLVLGVENVPRALAAQKQSDVRYYHAAEQPEAEKIATALRNAGEAKVAVLYLKQFENSKATRPNHFEVWLAHHDQAQAIQ